MDKIRDNIYIGNSHDAQHEKPALKAAGITAILNVAWDLTNKTTTHNEFKMCKVGLVDGNGNNPIIALAAVMTLQGLLQAGERVLIHCHEGKSRSVAVTAAYLVAEGEHPDLRSAVNEIKQLRNTPGINQHLYDLFTSII